MTRFVGLCATFAFLWAGAGAPVAIAGNFISGEQTAAKFGVHEIVLTGDGGVANPFDTIVKVRFTPPSGPLRGLDSVKHVRDYFERRRIELSDFSPDHAATDVDVGAPTRAPKVMRHGREEYLVYHPNAATPGPTRIDQRDFAWTFARPPGVSPRNGIEPTTDAPSPVSP